MSAEVARQILKKIEDEVAYRCDNPECPAIIKESLKLFASRRAMNIEKLGDKLIEALVDHGLVKIFSDFYQLKKEKLSNQLLHGTYHPCCGI